MNLLQRALIEKAGHDNGFEHVRQLPNGDKVVLASARHGVEADVHATDDDGFAVTLSRCQPTLPGEMARSFPEVPQYGVTFHLPSEAALARWLRRATTLAQALPLQVVATFEVLVQAELASLDSEAARNTEVHRLVRQRIGQGAFRQAMLDYWGGACAVTGVALPQALRASHAKAWALCDSDAERLDVYNGFLLSANLDALFDTYLVTFGEQGTLQISPVIGKDERAKLSLIDGARLRWLDDRHHAYLEFHRSKCEWLTNQPRPRPKSPPSPPQ
jgi:putative restriction endonuclease